MKNLVMGNDYIETYDDVFSTSLCSELIKLVEEKNERIENEHRPNFYQRNIGNMPEYSGMYEKFSELGMNYLKAMIIFHLVVGLLVPIMNGWPLD